MHARTSFFVTRPARAFVQFHQFYEEKAPARLAHIKAAVAQRNNPGNPGQAIRGAVDDCGDAQEWKALRVGHVPY
ncbi:MAG TPA: hypothetical protein VMO26_13450 [Vicinamibacterales bacterium]|nr:hypothetical protein [Vicinamibacterales bacterium]